MKTFAEERFKDKFGHKFDASYRPADSKGAAHMADQVCIIYGESNLDSQMSTFADHVLRYGSSCPSRLWRTIYTVLNAAVRTFKFQIGWNVSQNYSNSIGRK